MSFHYYVQHNDSSLTKEENKIMSKEKSDRADEHLVNSPLRDTVIPNLAS